MKIAQIVCTFPPYRGGIGNSVFNIAGALAGLGHKVTVFTPDYGRRRGSEADDRPAGGGEKLKIVKLRPVFKFGNAALTPQLFGKLNDFDVVHLHYPFFGAVAAVLLSKFFHGKKMNLILHYHMDNRAAGLKGAIFYVYKTVFLPLISRAAEVITCASLDYVKHSDLKKYYRRRPDKFRQILFGVNLEQFAARQDDQGGLNERRPNNVLLFVGGLDKAHYFKGLKNLLKALAEIRREPKFSATVLNVVGQGNLLNYYQSLAKSYGLAEAVSFFPEVNDNQLVSHYNHCDALVLPSINQGEAFGLVLLEAMACAKPVIASNLPGVRSVFKNGVQGLLVKPGEVRDLAEKLKIMLADKKKARAMGQAGRELVEKKYTWDKVGKRLDLIYHFVKYSPKL